MLAPVPGCHASGNSTAVFDIGQPRKSGLVINAA